MIAPTAKHPCPECPFRRDTEPGRLGGSPTDTYVGQLVGPFALPCHMQYKGPIEFTDPSWKMRQFDTIQCAGASIFRANLGFTHLPGALMQHAPDDSVIFTTLAEFKAHHDRMYEEQAEKYLSDQTIGQLLRQQLRRVDNQLRAIPKETL